MRHPFARTHNLRQTALVLLLSALISCTPARSATEPGSDITVSISPESSSVLIGEVLVLVAQTRDSRNGERLDEPISWISSDSAVATVSSNGTVTALRSGTAVIRAKSAGATGHSEVHVKKAPDVPRIASIVLSPSADTTTVGAAAAYEATLRDSLGTVLDGFVIEWSSTNPSIATISSSGVATAVGSGTTTLRASADGVTGDALLVVRLADSSPQPPALYPNLPAGLTPLIPFTGTVEEVAGAAFGSSLFGLWELDPAAPPSHIEVVSDPSNPLGTGSSLRFTYDQQYNPRSGNATANGFDVVYSELYVMTRIYLEPGGGWSGFGNKYFYIGAAPGARHNSGSPTQFYNTREMDGRLRFVDQNTGGGELIDSSEDAPKGNNSLPLVTGQWLNIEYRLVAQSSSDVSDGALYVWVNGVLVGSNTAVRWVLPGDPVGFSGMEWYGDCNTVTSRSFYRLGELYIAGRP